jgi:hypothetical protein
MHVHLMSGRGDGEGWLGAWAHTLAHEHVDLAPSLREPDWLGPSGVQFFRITVILTLVRIGCAFCGSRARDLLRIRS